MKPKKIFAGSLLAAGGATLLLLAPNGHAQTVTYTTGDLLLGFEETGSTNNYIVDLGPASTYVNAAPGSSFNVTLQLNLGNIAADLASSSGFGSNWALNTGTNTVSWGIAGGTDRTNGTFGLPKDTLFLTETEVTPGTPTNSSTPLTRHSQSFQATIDGTILNSLGGAFNGAAQTANSTVGTFQTSATTGNWSSFSPGSNAFNSALNIEQNLGASFSGPTNSALDLYELQPGSGAGTYVGNFSLSSSGNLTFQAAVPEPGSLGLVTAASLLLSLWRLRRPITPVS